MVFWNDDCQKLSNKLWIPGLLGDPVHDERQYFKCMNPGISFNYFSDNAGIDPRLKFNQIPLVDNSMKKNKLNKQLSNKEFKRFCREVDKKHNIDLNEEKELWNKHFDMFDKIDTKVSNIDKFIRSRRIQLNLNNTQKKIIQQ